MNPVYDKLLKCYDCYKAKIDFEPKVAVVLGSGLGNFAKVVDVKAELPYSEIEGFPVSTVPGHAGTTPLRTIGGINKSADIKSSIEEKSLKIPDFLSRNNK